MERQVQFVTTVIVAFRAELSREMCLRVVRPIT
jgi:hypothetical protein